MRRMFHRVIALTLVIALGGSVWATCLEAAQPTKAQMACCEHGHNGCAPGGKAADCCNTGTHGPQGFTNTERVAPHAPDFFVYLPVERVDLSAASWHQFGPIETASPPHSKHPTYVVLSTLRL